VLPVTTYVEVDRVVVGTDGIARLANGSVARGVSERPVEVSVARDAQAADDIHLGGRHDAVAGDDSRGARIVRVNDQGRSVVTLMWPFPESFRAAVAGRVEQQQADGLRRARLRRARHLRDGGGRVTDRDGDRAEPEAAYVWGAGDGEDVSRGVVGDRPGRSGGVSPGDRGDIVRDDCPDHQDR